MSSRKKLVHPYCPDEVGRRRRIRGNVWGDDETETLLKLWKAPGVQGELRSVKRNQHVYAFIANQLKHNGVKRSGAECKTRIKCLKHRYFVRRQQLEEGIEGGAPFKFFTLMDEVLATYTSSGSPIPDGTTRMVEMTSDSQDEEGAQLDSPARRDKVKEEVISEEEDEEEGGDQEDDETDQTWSPLSDRSLVSGPSDSRDGNRPWQEAITHPSPVDRGVSWSERETENVVNIWAQDDKQIRLATSYRNVEVYDQIARELRKHGYNRSAEQCRSRIKLLKCMYRKAKSGARISMPSIKWKCFATVGRILEQGPLTQDQDTDSHDASVIQDYEANISISYESNASVNDSGTSNLCLLDGPDSLTPPSGVTSAGVHEDTNTGEVTRMRMEDSVASGSAESVDPTPATSVNKERKPEAAAGSPSHLKRPRNQFRPLRNPARLERLVDRVVDKLVTYQNDAEVRRLKWEERRFLLTMEDDARRRREQREHEVRMFEMIQRMSQAPCCSQRTLSQAPCCCSQRNCGDQNLSPLFKQADDHGTVTVERASPKNCLVSPRESNTGTGEPDMNGTVAKET